MYTIAYNIRLGESSCQATAMSIDWGKHSRAVNQRYGDSLSATRHIRHVLLAAIDAGDIMPGTRLTETELGKQLGFSRTKNGLAVIKSTLNYALKFLEASFVFVIYNILSFLYL